MTMLSICLLIAEPMARPWGHETRFDRAVDFDRVIENVALLSPADADARHRLVADAVAWSAGSRPRKGSPGLSCFPRAK